MTELLTKCGFRCDLCPAYCENIKSDDDKVKVSEGWRRLFGFNISQKDVECVGCHREGKHADANCPVRPCVLDKGVDNCACCDSFGCEKLKTRMDFLADYLTKKDKEISDEDYQLFIRAYEGKARLMKIRANILKTDK